MGKGWDHAVPGVEFWIEALHAAKPGAHKLRQSWADFMAVCVSGQTYLQQMFYFRTIPPIST